VKKSNSKKIQDLVEKFLDLKEAQRQAQEEVADLRAKLIETLGDEKALLVGDEFLVTVSERSRSDIDREKLKVRLGKEFDDFQNRSTYTVLDVKPV
jgi:hypothetical protein